MKKILEEIEQRIAKAERIIVKPPHDELDRVANDTAEAFIEAYKECQELIRKHMNDGWIPCEEERLPEDFEEVLVTDTGGRVRLITFNKFLFNHPEYTHEVKVIAWRPLPAPYRPEKGAEE